VFRAYEWELTAHGEPLASLQAQGERSVRLGVNRAW
jgi:hypothetical protein